MAVPPLLALIVLAFFTKCSAQLLHHKGGQAQNLHNQDQDISFLESFPSSWLEAGREQLRVPFFKGDSRVAEVCKVYGCSKGVKYAGRRAGSCFEKLRCAKCQRRPKGTTPEAFCASFPIKDRIVLLEGELTVGEAAEGEEEAEEEEEGDDDDDGGTKKRRKKTEDEDRMELEDGDDDEAYFDRRGFIQLSDENEIPSLIQMWWNKAKPQEGDWIGNGRSRQLQANPFRSTAESISTCDQSVFGIVNLRFDLFFAQSTDPTSTKNSPDIGIEASFTGTGVAVEECSTPALYRNRITREQLLQITLNVPVAVKEFGKLASEGFAEAIKEKLHVKLSCHSKAKCLAGIYLTCVKVTCPISPRWKSSQTARVASMAAEQQQLKDAASKAAQEYMLGERQKQIAAQNEKIRQLKAQKDANTAAWDRYNAAVAAQQAAAQHAAAQHAAAQHAAAQQAAAQQAAAQQAAAQHAAAQQAAAQQAAAQQAAAQQAAAQQAAAQHAAAQQAAAQQAAARQAAARQAAAQLLQIPPSMPQQQQVQPRQPERQRNQSVLAPPTAEQVGEALRMKLQRNQPQPELTQRRTAMRIRKG